MSYCRIGDDSDVYVYASIEGGYTIIVAEQRAVGEWPTYTFPEEHKVYEGSGFYLTPEGAEAHARWIEENWKSEKIDLPEAGESFHYATTKATYEKLEELHKVGYKIPYRVFKRLADEGALKTI